MKIEYVKGDLMQATSGIIAHGCNAQGVMGSGVAKAVRAMYPGAYTKYNNFCTVWNFSKQLLGNVVFYEVPDKKLYIANCITQHKFGADGTRYVDYEAVEVAMGFVNIALEKDDILHIPMIGAGLGGGDWDVISEIIERKITNGAGIKCWVI